MPISDYDRTVAAAVAETRNKFALAEALALDIPPRRRGPTAEDEQSVIAYLDEAREAIVTAGGEPREARTLRYYRLTALWVSTGDRTNFRWIEGVSFTAHDQARAAGLTYDEFAAMPIKKARAIRADAGIASKDGPPDAIIESWTPAQKTAAARELLTEPGIAEEVVKNRAARAAFFDADLRHTARERGLPDLQDRVVEPMPMEWAYEASRIAGRINDTTRDYEQVRMRWADDPATLIQIAQKIDEEVTELHRIVQGDLLLQQEGRIRK